MQKLSKFIKKNILGFVVGGICAIVMGVSAATVLNGTQIAYKNNESVQAAIDRLYTTSNPVTAESCTTPTFNVGDYIEIKPNSESYKILPSISGYDTEQEIDPSELTLWRVINKTPCNVEVVSEYTSSAAVYFKGATGYANYVGALNEIARQYMNAKLTSSARMVGYNGQTEYITDTSAFNGTSTSAPSTVSTDSPTTGNGQEYNGGVLGDTLYLKDYQAIVGVYGSLATTDVVSKSTASRYWIASRRYKYNSDGAEFGFTGRSVGASTDLSNSYLLYYNSGFHDDDVGSRTLRPILTLKSGLTAKSGNGQKATPYKL